MTPPPGECASHCPLSHSFPHTNKSSWRGRHVCEAFVQWDAAGKAEVLGGNSGSAVRLVANAAGSSAAIADSLGGSVVLEPHRDTQIEAARELEPEPEAELESQPESLEQKLHRRLGTLRFLLEDGHDTGQVRAPLIPFSFTSPYKPTKSCMTLPD